MAKNEKIRSTLNPLKLFQPLGHSLRTSASSILNPGDSCVVFCVWPLGAPISAKWLVRFTVWDSAFWFNQAVKVGVSELEFGACTLHPVPGTGSTTTLHTVDLESFVGWNLRKWPKFQVNCVRQVRF